VADQGSDLQNEKMPNARIIDDQQQLVSEIHSVLPQVGEMEERVHVLSLRGHDACCIYHTHD
jgi:hypothetical protein